MPWHELTSCASRSRFFQSSEIYSLHLQKYALVFFENMFVSQVSDLVELTKQQALTIRRLERDSLAKSDRIADIETRWP